MERRRNGMPPALGMAVARGSQDLSLAKATLRVVDPVYSKNFSLGMGTRHEENSVIAASLRG